MSSNGRKPPDANADKTPPAEPHVRPHQENLPYIKVLGDAIPILAAVLNTLGQAVHELRLQREPADPRTLAKIRVAGAGLERAGLLVKRGFRGA
jgi:hypothetical protein